MGKMLSWNERIFFSMLHDCEMARITGFDDNHQAHWLEIPTGKEYRKRRTEALERILCSIEQGDLAGEVKE